MSVVGGTRPYPWPFDGAMSPGRMALVVAGADSAWRARCSGAPPVERTLLNLASALAGAGVLVVRVRHPSPSGAAPRPWALPPAHRDVDAGGVDGFFASALDGLLRAAGRDRLILGGFGLEGPVHSTLRSANDRGYECLMLTDACAALDANLAHSAFSMVCMSGGIFGAVGESTALMQALGATTTHREDA